MVANPNMRDFFLLLEMKKGSAVVPLVVDDAKT
jgi:hypothetical protein